MSFTLELANDTQLVGRIYCLGGSPYMTIIIPGQQTLETYLTIFGNEGAAASYINQFGCFPMIE